MDLRIAAVLIPIFTGGVAHAQGNGLGRADTRFEILTSEILVRLTPGGNLNTLLSSTELDLIHSVDGSRTFLLSVPAHYDSAQRQQALMTAWVSGETTYAEFNRFARSPEAIGCQPPTGTSTSSCTIAFFDGEPLPERYHDQPAIAGIELGDAHSELSDHMTIVAVIDTGIDPTHEVFAGKLHSPGYDLLTGSAGGNDIANGVDDDNDGWIDEGYGHGTHVAGTIVLINPNARILPIRVLDSEGNGTAADVALAIHLALADGAQVINLSLSMLLESRVVADALDAAGQLDVAVFTSAGNMAARRVLFPGTHPHATAVAALDDEDSKAPFSSYGPLVEISAPGVDIYSAMPGGRWAWWSGTSMSTAIATGAGSLVGAIEDDLELALDVPLVESAADVDDQNPEYAGLLGAGLVDVEEALEYADHHEHDHPHD